MPSWIPGEDHLINFQKGDPYVKVDEGYARLPGAGYEALHPELEGLDPEDYPDINKLSILGDVAPYSRVQQGEGGCREAVIQTRSLASRLHKITLLARTIPASPSPPATHNIPPRTTQPASRRYSPQHSCPLVSPPDHPADRLRITVLDGLPAPRSDCSRHLKNSSIKPAVFWEVSVRI